MQKLNSVITVIDEISRERKRQIEVKGYGATRDDSHPGELAQAAACYARHAGLHLKGGSTDTTIGIPSLSTWPWEMIAWNPKGARQDLIRAAALIVAEIERLDRSAQASHKQATGE